jgi:hypothetical protein
MGNIPILICASGDFHRKDAASFISRHENLQVLAALDKPIAELPHDRTIIIDSVGFAAKIAGIMACQLDEFLYVDTDTSIYSLDWVNYVRSKYDLAAAFEPIGVAEYYSSSTIPYNIAPFEYNTGVLYIKKTKSVKKFLHSWKDAHAEGVETNGERFEDQISFRRAALLSSIPLGALPNNLNYRAMYSQLISGPIKIVHSRRPSSYAFRSKIIEQKGARYLITPKMQMPFESNILKLLRWVMRRF